MPWRWFTSVALAGLLSSACSAEASLEPVPSSSVTSTLPVPTPENTGPTTTSRPASEVPVLLVGDSTLEAVEAYSQWDGLWGFAATFDAASCRTLAVPSCGSEPPLNVTQTLHARGQGHRVAVVMAGYDEYWESVEASIDGVEIAARSNGLERLIWLTFRESPNYIGPNGLDLADSYRRSNQLLRTAAAEPSSMIDIADWDAYSAFHPEWYEADGIHLSPSGALAVADYISQVVSNRLALPCLVHPDLDAATSPCPDPDAATEHRDLDALYATS